MKRGNNPLVLCLFGILPVVWLGLLIAPAAGGGLPEILARFPAAMNDPFKIELCGDSLKTVLVLLCVYGLATVFHYDNDRIRQIFQAVSLHGDCAGSSLRFCGRTLAECGKELYQILRRCLLGRRDYCTGLHCFFLIRFCPARG